MKSEHCFRAVVFLVMLLVFLSTDVWGATGDEPGWCCKGGDLTEAAGEAARKDCLQKGGEFFENFNQAKSFCALMQKGYCIKNDVIKPMIRKQCQSAGGKFFRSKAKATGFYNSKQGYCLSPGKGVGKMTRGRCKDNKGRLKPFIPLPLI